MPKRALAATQVAYAGESVIKTFQMELASANLDSAEEAVEVTETKLTAARARAHTASILSGTKDLVKHAVEAVHQAQQARRAVRRV